MTFLNHIPALAVTIVLSTIIMAVIFFILLYLRRSQNEDENLEPDQPKIYVNKELTTQTESNHNSTPPDIQVVLWIVEHKKYPEGYKPSITYTYPEPTEPKKKKTWRIKAPHTDY